MSDLLPFLVVGLVTGSLYGLTGMGLVLTYKTSGIFNFAHGAVATVAAYGFYSLYVTLGWPWPIALLVSVLGLGTLLGLVLERLARVLAEVGPALQIVATVGLLITVQGVAATLYGTEQRSVPPFLPIDNLRVAGVNVGVDQLIVVLVALAAAAGLFVFFRVSTLGLAMQAVVDDPALLAMGGRSPVQVRLLAWVVGSTFACLSGVLLVPNIGLDATILTLLVVQAFGAAAVGFFSSLPLTYAGGLLVGVLAALSTRYLGSVQGLAGLPSAVPFLVLFLVLVFAPKDKLVTIGGAQRLLTGAPPSFSRATRAVGGGGGALVLLLLPLLVGSRLPVYTNGVIFIIIFLSLHLLVRTSGQVSLSHASFAAVGAATFSHLAVDVHLPWLLAVLGAGLLTVPVGALVAVPAIRLSGLYLGVATFGFGILLERLLYGTSLLFGAAGARPAPRPEVFGLDSDRGYYYVVLAVAAAAAVLSAFVVRGRLGRLLRGMSDSPVALSTLGTGVNSVRVLVFCLSAFMAGIAGALFGGLTQSINGTGFSFFASLTWLTILVISGAPFRYAPLPTAVLGGINIAVLPAYLTNEKLLAILPAVFGLAAVANAVLTDRGRGSTGTPSDPDTGEEARRRAARSRSPVTARLRARGASVA
ncbi:MAG: putative Sulfate-transporting ATPase [Frankiales bacterium]|nr:putative Sulfate-transporting ATPase [Frankiales bacterium]